MSSTNLALAATPPAARSRRGRRSYDVFEDIVIPVTFFFFMASISRVGSDILPGTTNVFWAIAYACLFWAIVRRPTLYLDLMRRNALLLVAAMFTACSAFWSLTPGLSAYTGAVFVLNVMVGLLLAERLGLRKVLIFVFCFGLITQSLSLALYMLKVPIAVGEGGELKGLYFHKNSLSMHANLLYLNGIVLFMGGWRRSWALIGAALGVAEILLSHSGTGLVLLFFTTTVFAICLISTSRREWSTLAFGVLFVLLSAAAAFIVFGGVDLFSDLLGALGKDRTLTGRTVLWDQAFKAFDERPWLGLGYYAFWNSTETPATAIWILIGQQLQSFHNIYLDRLVDVGAVGLGLLVAAVLRIFWTSWFFFRQHRTPISAWPFVYMSFITVLGFSEYPIFWNSEFQLLMSLAAATTCGATRRSFATKNRLAKPLPSVA